MLKQYEVGHGDDSTTALLASASAQIPAGNGVDTSRTLVAGPREKVLRKRTSTLSEVERLASVADGTRSNAAGMMCLQG